MFTNYRTSVLNDFSPVSKAFFQIYQDGGDKGSSFIFSKKQLNRTFKFIEQFPVQINPNELQLDYYSRAQKNVQEKKPIDSKKCKGVPLVGPEDSGGEGGTVTIRLRYNIYDEYKARTIDGAIPENGISLHSDGQKITSLEKLREYAGNRNGYYAMFVWGEVHIFGFMNGLNITYDAFSRWGDPLSATAEVTISRQPLEYDGRGIEKDPFECIGTLDIDGIGGATLYQKIRDTAIRVELLASNALR